MLRHFEAVELQDAAYFGRASDGGTCVCKITRSTRWCGPTNVHHHPIYNHHTTSALACLFVAKDNDAGIGLYTKHGFETLTAVDLRRKRFRPLLDAGAVRLEEVDSVWFMAKYVPPPAETAGAAGEA